MSAAWRASAMWQLVCTASTSAVGPASRRPSARPGAAAARRLPGGQCGHQGVPGQFGHAAVAFVRRAHHAVNVGRRRCPAPAAAPVSPPHCNRSACMWISGRPAGGRRSAKRARSCISAASVPQLVRATGDAQSTSTRSATARRSAQLAHGACATAGPWRRRSCDRCRSNQAQGVAGGASMRCAVIRRRSGPASRTWHSRSSAACSLSANMTLMRCAPAWPAARRAGPWRAPTRP